MIALACSFFMVLSMLITSSQTFLTAPVPGYAHGLTTYSSTLDPAASSGSSSTDKSASGPLSSRLALAASSEEESNSNDDDVDDDDDPMADYLQPKLPKQQRRAEQEQAAVYVFEFDEEDKEAERGRASGKDMSDEGSEAQSPLDPWSIVWYIGSFGGLVAFFLIVSCSEWCCRRGARPLSVPYTQRGEVINASGQAVVTESPPPPYHLFAPPPYDSVNYADLALDKSPAGQGSGEKLDIYVITLPISSGNQQQQPANLQQQQQQPRPPA